ncbi:MAG: hypothetical protein ACOCT9_00110 [archaeon]
MTQIEVSFEQIMEMADQGATIGDLQSLDIKAKSMEEFCKNE